MNLQAYASQDHLAVPSSQPHDIAVNHSAKETLISAFKLPHGHLLFDVLPLELLERISAHLTNGTQSASLLPVAETCATLSEAVMATLSGRVTITPDMPYHEARRWAALKKGLCSVRLEGNVGPPCFALLKKNHLTSVYTVNDMFLLSAVRMCSVKQLCVNLRSGYADESVLIETLAALQVEVLRLECGDICTVLNCSIACSRIGRGRGRCWMVGNKFAQVLEMVCTNVWKLEVMCRCGHADERGLWKAVPKLKGVREVRFAGDVEEDEGVMQRLKEMDVVRMMDMRRGWDTALKLGANVKEFWSEEALSEGMVETLAMCEGLEKLGIMLRRGGERGLVRLLKFLKGLSVLKVCWGGYVDVERGRLLEAIRLGERLEEVGFSGAKLEKEEVHQMLESVGRRLKRLQISVGGQREAAWERAEAVTRACIQYNSELRELRIEEFDVHEASFVGLREGMRMRDAEKWKRRMRVLLRLLQRQAPYLDMGCIGKFVEEVEEDD